MAQIQNVLLKKEMSFDKMLEMKIFGMFLLLFIVPTGIILLSHTYYSKNDTLLSLLAVTSMILILARIFYYTRKLDFRDESFEKYD